MSLLSNSVFDSGLNHLSTVNQMVICSQEPSTYTQANSTYKLGTKTSPTIGSPSDRSGGGREVTISSITDGTVSTTGTATHWALINTSNSELIAAGSLNASISVTAGNVFTLTSFTIGFPDPA